MRSRSSGCRNCVKRRVKCDEHYPSCVRCSKVDLTCDGVPARHDWIVYQMSGEAQSGQKFSNNNGTHHHASRTPLVMTTCYSNETASLVVRPLHHTLTDDTPDMTRASSRTKLLASSTNLQPESFNNTVATMPLALVRFDIQSPSGKLNPFATYPPLESSEGIDQIIRYAWSSAWPRLVTAASVSESTMCVWFYTMIHSPMLFYANIFGLGGLFAYHGLIPEPKGLKTQHECYRNLLRLVAATVDEVTNSNETPSEELLTSVLILSAYGHDPSSTSSCINAAEPTDSAVDPYYFYLTTTNYCHSSALRTLVSKAGGISAIQTSGIADLICLHDLVVSTIHMTRPHYRCWWSSKLLREASLTSTHVSHTSGLSENDPRLEVLLQMRVLLAPLGPSQTEDDTKDSNCARNEIQHRTLSLPDSAFRIAALLFNDIVFFPSPATTCTRQKLARSLEHLLTEDDSAPMMSLWMAMVGALTSADSAQEDDCFFLQVAATRVQSLAIPHFDALNSMLSGLVWDEKSLGQHTRDIWDQVGYLRHP